MSEEKKDIEFVTLDTQVKEFISKEKNESKTKKHSEQEKMQKTKISNLKEFCQKYTNIIWYVACILALILLILASTLGLKIPIVTVGIVILIEACLVKCFEGLPIWVHSIFVLFQLILGIFVHQILFMIMVSALYFVFLNFSNYFKKILKK